MLREQAAGYAMDGGEGCCQSYVNLFPLSAGRAGGVKATRGATTPASTSWFRAMPGAKL